MSMFPYEAYEKMTESERTPLNTVDAPARALVDEPTVDEPTIDEPPIDEPPIDEPPVDEPPVD